MAEDLATVLEECFRREWPVLVAAAARIVNDFARAEEIAQDVMVTALDRWPFTGVPERPGAWLLTATRNRARNAVRDESRARARDVAAAVPEVASGDGPGEGPGGGQGEGEAGAVAIGDDRLALLFTCCHSVLTPELQVALTLRLVGGLSTVEIARAFLVPETTMAQRLVRAKRRLGDARRTLAVPDRSAWPERLPAVLAVVYLVFNEGYSAASGPALTRPVLCAEARRLAALLAELAPEEPEVHGLVALLALQAARLHTRTDDAGDLVLLEDQDRRRWDRVAVAEGRAAIERALAAGEPGPTTLQAMVAGCHAAAASWADTDWTAVLALYDRLLVLAPTPVVALNRAVALSMASSPVAALAAVDRLAGPLDRYHPYWATRAQLLARLGRAADAAVDYRRAASLAANEVERRFLLGRAAACVSGGAEEAG